MSGVSAAFRPDINRAMVMDLPASLVPRDIPIYRFVYDVKSGGLREVAEATELDKAA